MRDGAKTSSVKTMITFKEFTNCSGDCGVDSERFTVGTCTASAAKMLTVASSSKYRFYLKTPLFNKNFSLSNSFFFFTNFTQNGYTILL